VAKEVLSPAKLKKVLAALNENWQAEVEAYHTYLALAERDTEPVRAQVLRHLASAEWEHAALWHGRILELGGAEPVYRGKPGGEADSLANRAGGVRMALRRLEIEESRHVATYGEQLKALGDEGSIAILDHVIEDEKDHYRELGSLLRGHYAPSAGAPKIDAKAVLEEMLAKRSQGRKQPGAWIGDAIYGVNDGLGQQIRASRRPLRHDRLGPQHGFRRLPGRKERARNLSGRGRPRARSHPDERP